jgi:hypothetical protein
MAVEMGGPMRTARRLSILLVFGIGDLILGIILVWKHQTYAGIVVLIIGALLAAARWSGKAAGGGSDASSIRLSPYAYQYAIVGVGFLTLAIALLAVTISSASQGDSAKSLLAAVGGLLALAIAVGTAFSVVAARRIASGQASRAMSKWLPGWRLFIQEPNRGEQHESADDEST